VSDDDAQESHIRFPWDQRPDSTPSSVIPSATRLTKTETTQAAGKGTRGRRRLHRYAELAVTSDSATACLAAALTVTGPAGDLARFMDQARGPGVIPWRFDAERLEEDAFLMAVRAPGRSLTVEGCRILARQFRLRAIDHHHRSQSVPGWHTRCPLDLHALLPVPPDLLRKGADEPASRSWVQAHWGVGGALQRVVALPRARRPRGTQRGHDVVRYSFFTDGTLPQAAVKQLTGHWPTLEFALTVRSAF